MVIELTSFTDLLNAKCGIIGSPLRSLLTYPNQTAELITSPPGRDFRFPDITLLHNSAKYTDNDMYYERILLLSDADITEQQKNNFYIDKFYRDEDGTNKTETLRPLMESMATITREKKYIYSNQLINYFMENDNHAKAAGGCVCILATCADLMKSTPLNINTYYKLQKHFADHQFKYSAPTRFLFTPLSRSTRRKKTANGLVVFEPAPTLATIEPEEHFLPNNTNSVNKLIYGTVLDGENKYTGKTIHNLATQLVGTLEPPSTSSPPPVYPPAPSILSNIPSNIGYTGFMVSGKSYYFTKRTIGKNGKVGISHVVKFSPKEAKQVLGTLQRKYASTRKQRKPIANDVQIFYRGKWVPIELKKEINTRKKRK
jgi:hypothetical protein